MAAVDLREVDGKEAGLPVIGVKDVGPVVEQPEGFQEYLEVKSIIGYAPA